MQLRKVTGSSGLNQLANEMTYRRYMTNRVSISKYFSYMTIPEYIVLCMAKEPGQPENSEARKVYLADIAERMQMPVRQTSALIGRLRDRGFITWTHDGNGSEGTYVQITDLGRKKASEQEEILSGYYGNVIDKFGKENIVHLLQMMNELDSIISEEISDDREGIENEE